MSDNRTIGFILRVVDRASGPLRSSGRSLTNLGRVGARVGGMISRGAMRGLGVLRRGIAGVTRFGIRQFRRLSIAAVGVGAGMVYAAVRATRAWEDKSKTLAGVRRALQATGQATQANIQYLAKMSDWLQDVANISDGVADGMIAFALHSGVAVGEMEELLKATAAFQKIAPARGGGEMQGAMAMRLLIQARNTGATALRSYGIEVDATMTKEQQYAEVIRQLTSAYDSGVAKIDDYGSKMANLRLKIADVVKWMGNNIVEGLNLERVVDALRGRTDQLISSLRDPGNPFRVWLEDVRNLAVRVAAVISLLTTSTGRQQLLPDLGSVFGAVAADFADNIISVFAKVANMLIQIAPIIGSAMGRGLVEAWNKRKERREDVSNLAREMAEADYDAMPEWRQRSLQRNVSRFRGGGVEDKSETIDRLAQDYHEAARAEIDRRNFEQTMARGRGDGESTEGSLLERTMPRTAALARESLQENRALIDDEVNRLMAKFGGLEEHGTRDIAAPDAPAAAVRQAARTFIQQADEVAAGPARDERAEHALSSFLKHAQEAGASITEWKPSRATLDDVKSSIDKVAQNTEFLEDISMQH